jgi:hypothetical protein
VVVYNSDTESEEGDPKYRVGTRFSSYHNDPYYSQKESDNLKEQINEEIKE